MLGVVPSEPEPDYGWIEVGPPVDRGFRRIQRFVEKPRRPAARALMSRGGVWNTFVIIAAIPALLALVRQTLPDLAADFGAASDLRMLYRRLPSVGFSGAVLGDEPDESRVRIVDDVEWTDWGRPGRVLRTLDRLDRKPAWAERAAARAG